MEFRPKVRRSLGLVVRRPHTDERTADLGDFLQRIIHYHSQGRDTLFRQEYQVDDPQRGFISGQPRVLESRAQLRGGRRGKGLRSQDMPVARFQVDAGHLGDRSGRLFVFGSPQQVGNNHGDDGDCFVAATTIAKNVQNFTANIMDSNGTVVIDKPGSAHNMEGCASTIPAYKIPTKAGDELLSPCSSSPKKSICFSRTFGSDNETCLTLFRKYNNLYRFLRLQLSSFSGTR